ncbi:MAG: ATP-binding protein, partial [Phycisphaerae bacterium]|nr:ATP-binding protein [Phycisphaerae bacterium]
LNFSRNVEPNLQKTNVNAIMREVVELVRERAQEKNVRIETDLDTHLPEIMIDPDGIHHACLNILANAVDAVEPINGQIIVATRPGTKRRETVIEIKDNGPGIPRRQQKNIFTPFHSTKGHKGSGLGLAVAEKIVREHGGRITLRSEPAQGATFTIKLPNKPKAKTV